jgi:glycine cleavage system aminomethyltransferase T
VSVAGDSGSLDTIQRRAGAVFGGEGGSSVPLNYGSPAGELAVCVHGVGLVDHSDSAKLVLEGPEAMMSDLLLGLAGREIAPAQAVWAQGAWWCGAGSDRIVVICEPVIGVRLGQALRGQRLRRLALQVRDRSEDWAAIELVGRGMPEVLTELGAYHDPATAGHGPSFTPARVGGVLVNWLIESSHNALAVVERAEALVVWRAIETAGRPFGLAYVGREAGARYRLLRGGVRA